MARTKQTAVRNRSGAAHDAQGSKEPRKRPRKTLVEKASKKIVNLKGVKDAGVQGASERKKRRNHPGTVAKREARKEMRSEKPILKRAPFGRLVREIAFEIAKNTDYLKHEGIRFQAEALELIRLSAETMLTDLFRACFKAQLGAGHLMRGDESKRIFKETVTVDTMRGVRMALAHVNPTHVLATHEFDEEYGFRMRHLTDEEKEAEAERRATLPERYAEAVERLMAAMKKQAAEKASKKSEAPEKRATRKAVAAAATGTAAAAAGADEEEEDVPMGQEDEPRASAAAAVTAK